MSTDWTNEEAAAFQAWWRSLSAEEKAAFVKEFIKADIADRLWLGEIEIAETAPDGTPISYRKTSRVVQDTAANVQ